MIFREETIRTALEIGISQRYTEYFLLNQRPNNLMSLSTEITSKTSATNLTWITASAVVQQWVGTLSVQTIPIQDYTLRSLAWAAGYQIDQHLIEDDEFGLFASAPEALIFSLLRKPRAILIERLQNGLTQVAYDGVPFFSNKTGVRINDNLLSGTGITLDKLGDDLQKARVAMMTFKDVNDNIRGVEGNVIVCSPSLERKFLTLTQSATDATGTVADTFNPFSRYTVIVVPELELGNDVNSWYLLATNEGGASSKISPRPFITITRQGPRLELERSKGTHFWDTSVNTRGNVVYGLPRMAVKVMN